MNDHPPYEITPRSAAILGGTPNLMFLQSADGVYLSYHASDAAELLMPPEEFLGRNMRDVLPPALLQAIEPMFAKAVSAPGPVVFEYDLTLPHGDRCFEARLVRGSNDRILTLVRDVTEQKRAEAALQESAHRYALATTAGAVGVWDLNLESDALYVDATMKALLGFKDEEIPNRLADWRARMHPEDGTMLAQVGPTPGETDVIQREHRLKHKDGSYRWFVSHGSVMRRDDGTPHRLIGTSVDITERKRSADQFRLALEASTTGMLMIDGAGRIVLVNAHAERLFGYQRDELINTPATLLLPERGGDARTGVAGETPWPRGAVPLGGTHEIHGIRKDGGEIPLEIGFSPLRTSDGEFVLCSMVDVTERRQAERERDDLTRHLRDLAGRLIAAQEAERARLARDLHDDVSQQLALLSIELSSLKQRTSAVPVAADLLADVARLQTRVKTLADSVRSLSHDLHPDVLSHAGLTASLTAYCKTLSLSQPVAVACTTRGDFASIDPAIALCLYRITQEALHNVIKHADARHAEVRLLRTGDTAELTIIDDGTGFDLEARRGSGLGLISITERARLSAGTVDIVTGVNQGTHLQVRVPIRAAAGAGSVAPERQDASG